MANRTINISAKDDQGGISSVKIEAKIETRNLTPSETARAVEQFRDSLFKLLNESFYVSEIKQ